MRGSPWKYRIYTVVDGPTPQLTLATHTLVCIPLPPPTAIVSLLAFDENSGKEMILFILKQTILPKGSHQTTEHHRK
jgi:hypothetical protein